MKLKLSSFTGLLAFLFIAFHNPVSAAEDIVSFSLGNPAEFKVVEGEITVECSQDGYLSPGTVTLSGLKGITRGYRALVNVGKEFTIEGGRTYYLTNWIKASSKEERQAKNQARAVITWYDASHNEIGTLFTPWAIPPYDWLEYGEAGTTPKEAVTAQASLEVLYSSLGLPPPGFTPSTFVINNLTLSRTPLIEISTGMRCNLIMAGEPLNLEIKVDDVPQGFENASVDGTVLDFWRKPVSKFNVALRGEKNETTKTFPNLPRGYYSVEWQLTKNGKKTRDGLISAAIVPPLSARIADRDVPFALDAGLSSPFDGKPDVTVNQGTYMAQYLGVHALRERSGPLERMLKNAEIQQKAGIDPYHFLSQAFRNCLRNTDPSDSSSGELHLMEVYEGSKKLVDEFGDLILYWETWNEPDGHFFPGRPEEFAAISKAAYLGIHEGNPNAKVLLGSMVRPVGRWYRDVMKNGYSEYFDIFNMHYYGQLSGVLDRIKANRDFYLEFGPITKPIWMTEMGYFCYKAPDGTWWKSEQEQVVHLAQGVTHGVANGIDKFFYFYIQEFLENAWAVWGITRRNWTPKPSYAAYANLTYLLGRGKLIGDFDLGQPGSFGYVFETGKGPVIAAWGAEEAEVSFPGENATAVDVMGAPAAPKAISQYPIYVSGVDLNTDRFHRRDLGTTQYTPPDLETLSVILSLRAVRDKDAPLNPQYRLTGRKEPIVLEPGETLTLELKICNFSDESKTVDLNWTLPEGWKFVKEEVQELKTTSWSEQNTMIAVQPPNTQSGNYYEIQVDGSSPDRTITRAYTEVQMK